MQNFNKKGSILLWSILLSMILSIIFISISNKINLNLKQNISIVKNSEETSKINENLKKIEKIFKEIEILALKENIETEKLNIFIKEKKKQIENYYKESIIMVDLDTEEEDKEGRKKNILKEKENKEEYLNLYKNSEYKKSEIKKLFEKIENFKNISENLKIKINLKEENYGLQNGENLEIIIPANENIYINTLGGNIEYKTKSIILSREISILKQKGVKEEELKETSGKIKKVISFSSGNFYKKITLKNIGEYSKINIINSNYIISPKKYFQVVEFFGDKEILRQDGFLKLK